MQLKTMIQGGVEDYIRSLRFACPAVVTGIDNIQDGLIDVQPVVNRLLETMDSLEESFVYDVPVIFPATYKTAIAFPISIGDGVLLVYNHVDINKYKNGLKESHDPSYRAMLSNSTCVAYAGFNPVDESPLNPNTYRNKLNPNDLNIVHNRLMENEVTFSLCADGTVKVKAPASVNIEAPVINAVSETVNANTAIVKTDGDVVIRGKSVYQFMELHTHPYTDDGNPMTTSPPNPL